MTIDRSKQWHLKRGNEILGTLRVRDVDQPVFRCQFAPRAAFADVQPLFDEELRLLNAEQIEQWPRAYERIGSLGLVLESRSDGTAIRDFLLHIDGADAWLRY